ncbi:hypothetical protein FOA52_015031 [Chlamydomonas sp. UWO 241]|nr:hypothetical protein FOA52_015031 [Chlamydomonas sp. UWO 241]
MIHSVLISLRYGTVPIVRETGGLFDTVIDVAHSAYPEFKRNGFTFKEPTPEALEITLSRAFASYNNGYDWWSKQLVPRCMNQDWSWSRSAQDYLALYRSVVPAQL